MNGSVPHIGFQSALLPEEERLARYREAARYYDVIAVDQAFIAEVDGWTVGELFVTSNHLSALRFSRSAEQARGDGADHYSCLLLQRGAWTGDIGGRLLTVGPGQLVAFDLTQDMEAEGWGTDSVTLSVPRRSLEAALPAVPATVHGAVLGGALGRLFADHLLSLVRALPTVRAEEVPGIARATLDLFAACVEAVGEESQQAGSAAANPSPLIHRVRRYIDQNLVSADLTPDRICRDLGLSRSVLYRGFRPLGGIAAYIRARRLEAVHVLLDNPAEQRHISEIAYGFGFVSDAHFSRSFRRQFGYSPRAVRAGGLKAPISSLPAPPDPG